MAKIEWTDITRNPVKGKCPIACRYCYARQMYDDRKWPPAIRFVPDVMDQLPKKSCRIFVGSTMDLLLFPDWMLTILERCRRHPEHTFIFLTKRPNELSRYSPFPDNCDVGVSATDGMMLQAACESLKDVEASVKFVSIEPFIGTFHSTKSAMFKEAGITWVVVGAMTGRKSQMLLMQSHFAYVDFQLKRLDDTGRKYVLLPRSLDLVTEVVRAADESGAKIFVKDNLKQLAEEEVIGPDHRLYWGDGYYTSEEHPNIDLHLRQELPDRRVIN